MPPRRIPNRRENRTGILLAFIERLSGHASGHANRGEQRAATDPRPAGTPDTGRRASHPQPAAPIRVHEPALEQTAPIAASSTASSATTP